MDFFEAQDRARRKTRWLVLYFIAAIVAMAVTIYLGVLFALLMTQSDSGSSFSGFWNPELFTWSVCGTFLVIGITSQVKAMELKSGGGAVAASLGGRLIQTSTVDPQERQLCNIVEEMAIASGMPVPLIYVIDRENGINAFAAGTSPSNAAVGVTRGCLEILSRAELQGVIAHEFSHIKNGDMKLNMRLISYLFGITAIAILGRMVLRGIWHSGGGGRSGRRDKGDLKGVLVMLFIGVFLIAVGSLGLLFARLIQAAVSRQREFLADAAAVQFTREPDGLKGALLKIGGWRYQSRVEHPASEALNHMFFSSSGMFSRGFATHPPLQVRILALDPTASVRFESVDYPSFSANMSREASGQAVGLSAGIPEVGSERVAAVSVTEGLGAAESWRLAPGQALRSQLKEEWVEAARNRKGAQIILFAMVLSSEDSALQKKQVAGLRNGMGEGYVDTLRHWRLVLDPVHSALKIALLEIVIATLRQLSEDEYERLMGVIGWLVESDNRMDLFEFMLIHALRRHLSPHFRSRGKGSSGSDRKTGDINRARDVLASVIAWQDRNGVEAEESFRSALGAGKGSDGWVPKLLPQEDLDPEELTAALNALGDASPRQQEGVLAACGCIAAEDGMLTSNEVELLRAMADAVGVAVPPYLGAELTDQDRN